MTTVVNNPGDTTGGSSGVGLVLGIVVAVILVGLFVLYGLPVIMGNSTSPDGSRDVNVTLPNTGGVSSPAPSPVPSGGFTY